ncbi:MAG TPA: phophatidylserine decarboxylase associated domain-containing protein [Pyrinomonadaceae bacterium]|jgi:phosphatidylserine decarboxylase|nr:phophatidylserine decarboxylase associated domain-containing protein [Pyrinomonadaceae bacterium]
MSYTKEQLDARYRNQFGYLAGYLPKDRATVDAFQKELKEEVERARSKGKEKPHTRSVAALAKLINENGIVRMYVTQMIEQQPVDNKTVDSIPNMLAMLNQIVTTAPKYNADPNKLNNFPMSNLFTYMMMTPAGEAVFRNEAFNTAIANVLREWCNFLDSKQSLYVLNESPEGWLSQSAYWYNKLYEFVIPNKSKPHWGWKSFNDYFHREIKPECRPIAQPDDLKVVISANDGTVYSIASNVQPLDTFWLKAQPYSLINVLNNNYVDRFIGGNVFQSFLSGADYHRWVAPIAGTVRKTEIVDGLMFSDAESAGFDNTAATYSQGYEASVNTRGLVFIESKDKNIGMVCVIPIGITEISSVTITVKEGDKVTKGQELGYFSYGGSSMCLVFQPGAIDYFTVPNRPSGTNADDGPPIRVNAQIAVAR